MASKTINFRVSDELRDALDSRAAKETRTASEIAREVLEEHFLGLPAPAQDGVLLSPAQALNELLTAPARSDGKALMETATAQWVETSAREAEMEPHEFVAKMLEAARLDEARVRSAAEDVATGVSGSPLDPTHLGPPRVALEDGLLPDYLASTLRARAAAEDKSVETLVVEALEALDNEDALMAGLSPAALIVESAPLLGSTERLQGERSVDDDAMKRQAKMNEAKYGKKK